MPEELRVDAMELCVTACEKYSSNNEVQQRSFERTHTLKQASWQGKAEGAVALP